MQIYRLPRQLLCAPMYILLTFPQPNLIDQPQKDHQIKANKIKYYFNGTGI